MLLCAPIFYSDVQAPLYDSEDLLTLALYDSSQFPIYQVNNQNRMKLKRFQVAIHCDLAIR